MSEIGQASRELGVDPSDEPTRAFRRRGALHQWELHFGPNMTPMVDVVMVILIFFMASTAFLGPEWFLQAHMAPDEQPSGALQQDTRFQLPEVRLEVKLRAAPGGTLADAFGREGLTLEQFEALAIEIAADLVPERPAGSAEPVVVIDPEAQAPYNDVVRAHDACTKAGFRRVALR